MQAFDPRSIILITFFVIFLQFVILAALSRAMLEKIAGIKMGAIAAALWAIGAGCVVARGAISPLVSVYLGNLCLSIAVLLLYGALQDFRGARSAPRLGQVAFGSIYAVALWLAFASGDYRYLLLTITGFNAGAYSACAIVWRGSGRTFAPLFVEASLVFASLVSAARFATLWANFETPSQLYDPVSLQRLYLGLVSLSIISILLSYTLLIYDQIRALLERNNARLESEVAARTADLTLEIQRRRELERQISITADAERRKVGNELHDDLGQRLTGVSLVAEALSEALREQSPALAKHADAIQEATSGAISQVRRLAHGLMPVGPSAEDLGEALDQLARSSSLAGVACRFERSPRVVVRNQDVATNLYRIAQECLNNSIRHGMASRVSILLDSVDSGTRLIVEDNGIGLDANMNSQQTAQGYGMSIIEFRASVIKFDLRVTAAPGQGRVVELIEQAALA